MILRTLLGLWTSVARPMGDHLWQSTLFLAIAAILALALRENQARVRYWLWLSASVKFLIPFSLLIALGSHLAKPRVSTPAQVVVYSAVEDFSQPFAGQEMPVYSAPAAAPVSLAYLLPTVVVAVWLFGIVIVLLRWVVGWVRISVTVCRAVPVKEGFEVDALRRLEANLGVRTPIRLVLSPDWMEPGIFGVFRSVLIWPEGISRHLDDMHIETILAHEVCHARRRDNFTAVLHMLVEAVFWFHPLVWWTGAKLEEERERACDEEVSLLCNQPHIYAESILKVCKFCSESPLACVSGITGADLKKRILQIMMGRVIRRLDLRRKLLLLAVALTVLAVPIVLGQVKTAQRMMLAAMNAAPESFRAPTHVAQEQTPSTPLIAEADEPTAGTQPTAEAPNSTGPEFEVATIKPANPNDSTDGFHVDGRHIFYENQRVVSLIAFAYGLRTSQVVNAPAWVSERYDIQGVTDHGGEPNLRQQQYMLRKLLAERLHLKLHHEMREMPVYMVARAKGGLTLHKSQGEPSDLHDESAEVHGTQIVLHFKNASLSDFAFDLAFYVDRPVVDREDISGRYDFDLRYTFDEARSVDPNAPPGLFTAVQEQMGVKLEAVKAPADVVVIDGIEKPTMDGAEVPPTVAPKAMAQEGQAATPVSITTNVAVAKTSFEVASIRMVDANTAEKLQRDASMSPYPTTHFFLHNVPLDFLIGVAYGIDEAYIQNDAGWMDSQFYDVDARVGGDKPLNEEEMRPLLQDLLAQRFHLTVHRTSKVVSGFELVTAKGGPKLNRAKDREETHAQILPNRLDAQSVPIKMLASILMRPAGQPVVDKTGLTGFYDIRLNYAAPNDTNSAVPSLFTAIEEQLGLRLQPAKVPIDFLVIDHADRVPTEN